MTDRKCTTYITEAQYEWLRKKAFDARIPATEIVRRLIGRAMEEESRMAMPKAYEHPELAVGRKWDPENYCGLDWEQCYPILDGEGTIIGVLDGECYDHARGRQIDPEAEGLEFDEERECWRPVIEITEEDLQLLGQFCERDEAGRHFMVNPTYSPEWLDKMEKAGLIRITRPVHDKTGIPYSQEYWHAEVTPRGIALGEEREWGE